MKIIIAAAAALLAVPAAAQTPQSTRTPAIAAPAQAGGSAVKAKPTRYCVASTPTGTRIERKTCRTREAWLAHGYDPLEDVKK